MSKKSKKKRATASLSETFLNDEITDSPKKSPNKKNVLAQHKIKDFGECSLCGLRFEEISRNMKMSEKTRETNQAFGDILQRFFNEENIPDTVKNLFKKVELESGLLCILCVSYIEQMDVFQNKLAEVKDSIISVINGNKADVEMKSDRGEDDNIEDRPASKKRGRPPKLASDFTPMKKASSSERVVSPKKFDVGGTEDLAQKLQVLSGIEIKRINTETGEEVDARLELEVKNAEIKTLWE